MTAAKRSVSLDPDVAHDVERAAAEDGVSFSAWLSRAAADRLRIRDGLRGVAAWEADAGPLTKDEIAAGEALLDRLLAEDTRPRRPSRPRLRAKRHRRS